MSFNSVFSLSYFMYHLPYPYMVNRIVEEVRTYGGPPNMFHLSPFLFFSFFTSHLLLKVFIENTVVSGSRSHHVCHNSNVTIPVHVTSVPL